MRPNCLEIFGSGFEDPQFLLPLVAHSLHFANYAADIEKACETNEEKVFLVVLQLLNYNHVYFYNFC